MGGSQNGGAARAGNHKWQYRQLALNELSIPVRGRKPGKEALYVMAYRRLNLDVRRRTLRADDEGDSVPGVYRGRRTGEHPKVYGPCGL